MSIKLGTAVAGGILLLLAAQGCVFGGGADGSGAGSVARPGSIVTATLPATLTDPILLGQVQAPAGGSTAPGGSSGQTYVIKSGDTLGGIASAMGVTPDQQAAWIAEVLRLNNISDARLLAVGVELLLPRTAAAAGTPRPAGTPAAAATSPTPQGAAASTPAAQPTPTGQSSGRTYTVVSGDTPLLIAEKLNIPSNQRASWANELVALNGINASAMQVGEVLDLPAGTP
jgi:LysM repeat protein